MASQVKNGLSQPVKLKILVALSGGVDSSVACQLLVNAGYDVSAVYLKLWQETKDQGSAQEDARAVAKEIGINFFTLDLSLEFKREVVDYFLKENLKARTPNPCVICNEKIKIGLLLERTLTLGYDFLATGHYFKIRKGKESIHTYRAKDLLKDQSYFLYHLNQGQLARLIFPLGDYTKPEVRSLAEKYGLVTAHKSDSQDICFIKGTHADFIKRQVKLATGVIRLKDTGEIIGKHQGLALYTIGQRKGINLGGRGPYYVVQKELETNTLWVAGTWDNLLLFKNSFLVDSINWLQNSEPHFPLNCQVAIRYGQKPVQAVINSYRAGALKVDLRDPVRAVVSGQRAVFYQKDELLGGGIIDNLDPIL